MTVLFRAPIRARLTFWYVFLLATILAAFSAGVYLLSHHALYENLDDSLQTQASALLNIVQFDGDRPFLPGQVPSGNANPEEYFARVFDASGAVSSDSSAAIGDVPVDAEALANALAGQSTTRGIRIRWGRRPYTGENAAHQTR